VADRYLLETSAVDGYQLEDASGVLLLDSPAPLPPHFDDSYGSATANPVRRKHAELGFVSTVLLLTTLAPTLAVFRAPLVTPTFERKGTQTTGITVSQSLPLTTLATTVAPFEPVSFDNPISVNWAQQPYPFRLPSSSSVAAPFSQNVWLSQTVARYVQQPEQVGKPWNLAEPFPARQRDWQNPTLRKPSVILQQSIQSFLLTEPRPVPFRTINFDNPGRRSPQQPDTFPNLALKLPALVDPFTQDNWLNPLFLRWNQQPYHFQLAPSTVTTGPLPFGLQDWPNPVRGIKVPQSYHFQPAYEVEEPPAAPLPYELSIVKHFPNPIRARYVQPVDYPPNTLTNTLDKRLVAEGEFENPRGYSRRQQPEIYPNLVVKLPPPPRPFAQIDWPNPSIARYVRQIEQVGKPWNLAQRFPVRLLDWPNPTLRIPQTRIEPPPYLLQIRGAAAPSVPSIRNDWANPVLAARNQDIYALWWRTNYQIQAPPIPTKALALIASSYFVYAGTPVTLSWSSSNLTTLVAAGGWTGIKALSGTELTSELYTTTTFTLNGTGLYGFETVSIVVTVSSEPVVTEVARPAGRVIFKPKHVSDTDTLKFNFISAMKPRDSILTKVVTASVYSGTDANPSNLIVGSALSNGTLVTQRVCNGVAGVVYELKCTITTASGNTLVMTGYLHVIADRKV